MLFVVKRPHARFYGAWSTRARKRSNPARPNIVRLIIFSLLSRVRKRHYCHSLPSERNVSLSTHYAQAFLTPVAERGLPLPIHGDEPVDDNPGGATLGCSPCPFRLCYAIPDDGYAIR
jgi:hypothetical protein